jgi:hypothetical protein
MAQAALHSFYEILLYDQKRFKIDEHVQCRLRTLYTAITEFRGKENAIL